MPRKSELSGSLEQMRPQGGEGAHQPFATPSETPELRARHRPTGAGGSEETKALLGLHTSV